MTTSTLHDLASYMTILTLHDPGTDLGDVGWSEGFVVDVGLDLGDDSVGYVVLVVLEQTIEELARVCQQPLARLPVVIDLLPGL